MKFFKSAFSCFLHLYLSTHNKTTGFWFPVELDMKKLMKSG